MTTTVAVSLRDRLAQRREQIHQERTFTLPVPGYEDMLAVRYRALSYEELRKIGRRSERLMDTDEGELAVASDTLINACVELLERRDDDSFQSLGCKWNPGTARDLFGVELPDDATARMALQTLIPGTQLMLHFQAYDEQMSATLPEIAEVMAGESDASSVAD